MKIFIGCGSSNEIPSQYFSDCKVLIDTLLKSNDLVYGGYNEGLMGICYNTAKENNNKIYGKCITKDKEYLDNINCDYKEVYHTIFDRTKSLLYESDAIVILPGGIGTINELISSIDSKRSDLLNKPILIYNSNHYYDDLLKFLDKLYSEKFTNNSVKNCYHVSNDIKDAINYLNITKDVSNNSL